MSPDARTILREALSLDDAARADLAAELLASLDDVEEDDPAAVTQAWADEIERQLARIHAGEDATEPWPVVRDRIRCTLEA